MLAIFLSGGPIAAADTALFASDQAIDITIEAPLRALLSDRDEKPEYRAAKLHYLDENGITHTLDIGVRPRGKTRRKPTVCQFPPLRLNFQTKQTSGTVFDGEDKLKLVTHCQDVYKSYQRYVRQEYLIYRILNLFTEKSFRVRPLNVTYVSTDSKRKPITSYAFLIEDRDQMAARNGYTYQTPHHIARNQLDAEAANLVEVFQYLIGNTDWSVLGSPGGAGCCHNAVLIAQSDDGPYVPVPYDFDYAGIINAPYAVPGLKIRTKSVRTRVYRGFCRPSDILEATLTRFRQRRDAIYELFRQSAGLNRPTLKKSQLYLDSFYKTINDPVRLEREIEQACR